MTLPIIHACTTSTYYDGAMDSDTTESTLGKRLAEAEDRNEELEAEVERLKEKNGVLRKVARDMRGALRSIADGIGDQKTAENALHRLASRGIADLDVDPESVGIKGRIEELEAEVERLRKQRDAYEKGLHDVRGRAMKILEKTHAYGGIRSLKEAAEDALDRAEADRDE